MNNFLNLLRLSAGAAVFLFSAGIARSGWNQPASGGADDVLTAGERSSIKVRFAKFRMINEANPSKW